MLRLEAAGAPGTLVVVSRLARPRALLVLASLLAMAGAGALAAGLPRVAVALAAGIAVVVVLGGRGMRVRFGSGRVTVHAPLPGGRGRTRALAEFGSVAVETVGEARARRAEALARTYRERAGGDMPGWLRPAPRQGADDHLRRIVLLPHGPGEPLAITAWLPETDDLETTRRELEALLR